MECGWGELTNSFRVPMQGATADISTVGAEKGVTLVTGHTV